MDITCHTIFFNEIDPNLKIYSKIICSINNTISGLFQKEKKKTKTTN